MKLIPITDISVGKNRQRRGFDSGAMMELTESIMRIGLMHPIVCREENGKDVLVAGERRFKAIQDIYQLNGEFSCNNLPVPSGMIPVLTLGELSTLEAEEAELEENTVRNDLTWQERAEALKRLHALRKAQREEAQDLHQEDYQAGKLPDYSVAELAIEVRGSSKGHYHDQTRKELIVANHMDKPEVQKAKTVDEAFKTLQRMEEKEKRENLATTVGATFSSNSHQLFHSDCLSWMKTYSGRPFDVILTDPPYGMGADRFGDGAGRNTVEHHYDDSYEVWRDMIEEFAALSFTITAPQAHLYCFCDIDRFSELKLILSDAGWTVHRTPIINTKQSSGRVPWPDNGPRRQWEMLIYAMKGKKITNMIAPDVIHSTPDKQLQHGAQKPLSLYLDLLKRSVSPGDHILDPFCGTGTIFPAATEMMCTAVGVEMNQESYGIALGRIKE